MLRGTATLSTMDEQANPDQTESPASTPEAPTIEIGKEEMEAGKVFAILSYALSFIGLPFFLVPMIMRDNDFSLYHSKQCLMIWLFSIAGSTVGSILLLVCVGIFILAAVGIMVLVFLIMGLLNAINGQAKPLPIIGRWGEEWFAGLHKTS